MRPSRTATQGISLERPPVWLGLAILTIALLRTPLLELAGSFLHLVDLVFQEAGHIVFAPFGIFMMSFGGSLFQVIVPPACVGKAEGKAAKRRSRERAS